MKSKPVNIFTILDYLTYSKKPYEQLTDEEKEVINPYMLHRFISMNENYVGITNLAQNFPPTEKEKIYKFYLEFIPKNKVYLKYIKSSKKNLNSKLLEILSNYFKVSRSFRLYSFVGGINSERNIGKLQFGEKRS